jgi:hypothetical protein
MLSEVEAANPVEAARKAGKVSKHKRTELSNEELGQKFPNGCYMLFCWDDLPKREGGVEERLTVCLTITKRG